MHKIRKILPLVLSKDPILPFFLSFSTETLATMIKQLLPETLNHLHETNTRYLGALYSTWVDSQVYGVTETRCFTNLLSAVLERNAPKVDSAFTHTGTASISSRLSGSRIDSRASSAMLSTYRYSTNIHYLMYLMHGTNLSVFLTALRQCMWIQALAQH